MLYKIWLINLTVRFAITQTAMNVGVSIAAVHMYYSFKTCTVLNY